MASQAIIYATHSIPLIIFWLATVLEWLPVLKYGPDCDCFRHFIYFAPLYAVISLGLYAMFSVIHGVVTFNDCADARKELIEEIKTARADLKKRKIIE